MTHAQRNEAVFYAFLAAICLLMTMKFFPGLENELAYAGNAFQTIYPDAFAGDIYHGPELPLSSKPLQLSTLYLFTWLVGEPWLNDFYLAGFYLLIVAISLIGVDRIARHFGLENIYERALVLMFFAKDHQILTGKVLVAHHQDVNHSALAIPIIVWLTYFALARKHFFILIVMSVLLVATSPRNAFFPVVFAMMIKLVNGTDTERKIAAGLAVMGAGLLYAFLFHVYPIPETDRLAMWDILKAVEGDDANAFRPDSLGPMWIRHAAWLAIVGAAIYAAARLERASPELRTFFACGLFVWAAHGLYIEHAPDMIKMPLLLSLVPARSLSVIQNVAYIVLLSAALMHLRQNRDLRTIAGTLALFAFLYAAGPGNRLLWLGVVAAAIALSWAAVALFAGRRKESAAAHALALVVLPFLIATGVNYANAARSNWADWQSAWRHGVYGATASAKWIGIAEYLRYETPPGSSVLSFECARPDNGCTRLKARRGLAVRSGRAMPTPDVVSAGFTHAQVWEDMYRLLDRYDAIGKDLPAGDVEPLVQILPTLKPVPDYLVLPAALDVIDTLEKNPAFERVRTFPTYTVFAIKKDALP